MRDPVKQLRTNWLGRPLHTYVELNSTNTLLSELAARDAPVGTTVLAAYQSQGRGRGRRRWQAPPGTSLLFSLLFRPQWPAVQAHWLTMLSGLAIAGAVEDVAPLRVGLKWPNDVMIWDTARADPQWCKAGGILLETQLDGDRLQQAIAGIGLNVNIRRPDLPAGATPATSLLAAAGHPLPCFTILAHILQRLEALYEEAAAGHSPQPAWDARLITRNKHVRVTTHDYVVEGLAVGSDEWGRLLVRTPDGQLHRFAAADVTLR